MPTQSPATPAWPPKTYCTQPWWHTNTAPIPMAPSATDTTMTPTTNYGAMALLKVYQKALQDYSGIWAENIKIPSPQNTKNPTSGDSPRSGAPVPPETAGDSPSFPCLALPNWLTLPLTIRYRLGPRKIGSQIFDLLRVGFCRFWHCEKKAFRSAMWHIQDQKS